MGKPKKLHYRLIERGTDEGKPVYAMVERYVKEFHKHLYAPRIACAWAFSWKPNADGQVTLGKCKRSSDIDRELIEFDFVILLNRDFWFRKEVTDEMREALVDHELCHAAEAIDNDGMPKYDTRGRRVFRIRKHDIEEFNAVVLRHGVWKRDLQFFAQALAAADKKPLFAPDQPKPQLERTKHKPKQKGDIVGAVAKAAKDPKSKVSKIVAETKRKGWISRITLVRPGEKPVDL
jgi:hypothetical protein